jgi:hypothetical protein
MVSRWRYRCACYGTARHASAPATHAVHVADEFAPVALEYLPAVQETHVADEFAPAALEYLPAVQETHVDAPELGWYVPAGQLEHLLAPSGVGVGVEATICHPPYKPAQQSS